MHALMCPLSVQTRSHLLAVSCDVDVVHLLAELRSGTSTAVRDEMQWSVTDFNAIVNTENK